MRSWSAIALLVLLVISLTAPAAAQTGPDYTIESWKPDFVPVLDLLQLLGGRFDQAVYRVEWAEGTTVHRVDVRPHETANLLVFAGADRDVAVVRALAEELDVPPRQIEIEARIIEVNRSVARDLGIDWEELWSRSGTVLQGSYNEQNRTDQQDARNSSGSSQSTTSHRESYDRLVRASTVLRVSDYVRLLDETGAGSVRNTPRILTLNNRNATLLDGQRVTYVTRASSYANIYETQTMDAGLKLDVLPTLGESGYLTLTIRAELTGLTGGNVSGSPVKQGQILDNTVILKDGDTVVLGGFQRKVDAKNVKRFPVLGYILPFLFSRESVVEQTLDSVIVLTARIVDFDTAIDEGTQRLIDGG